MEVTDKGKVKKVYFNVGETSEGKSWWEGSCKKKRGIEMKKQEEESLSVRITSLRKTHVWGPGYR